MTVDILGHTLEIKKGLDADGFDVRMEEWKESRRTLRFLRTYDDSVTCWEVWAELQQARTSHLLRVSPKPADTYVEYCPLRLLSPS